MAEFQRMDGTKLPTSITAVVGNSISLKLIPGAGEKVPIPISVTPALIAQVQKVKDRSGPNFSTFTLVANKAGSAMLFAGVDVAGAVAGPIAITVEDKLVLPADTTEKGLLVRLLLAETPSPEMSGYSDKDAETVMIWMRATIANRLAKPSVIYGSKGATKIADVIRAKGQFKGFEAYPTISDAITNRLNETLRIANDGGDGRRDKYKKFVDIALKVAAMTSITDPSSKGLYFWRTAGSGSPSPEAKEFKTLMGNTFYTL